MDALAARFPHLDHFLNAYMHQDWDLYGQTLEDVLQLYAEDTSPESLIALCSDIKGFIAAEGFDLETKYQTLFPNSALPSAWHMRVDQWLRHITELVQNLLEARSSRR